MNCLLCKGSHRIVAGACHLDLDGFGITRYVDLDSQIDPARSIAQVRFGPRRDVPDAGEAQKTLLTPKLPGICADATVLHPDNVN